MLDKHRDWKVTVTFEFIFAIICKVISECFTLGKAESMAYITFCYILGSPNWDSTDKERGSKTKKDKK